MRLPVGDVVAHRVVEQDGVLGDDGDLRAQRRDGQIADVAAVNEQAPAGDVEEARQQVHQRGLARAAGADDCDHLSRPHLKIDVVQHLARAISVLIAEVNVLEAYALVERRQLRRAGLLAHIILGIEKIEDRRGRTQRLLEVVVKLPELAHRLVKLEDRDDERQEHALGEECRA